MKCPKCKGRKGPDGYTVVRERDSGPSGDGNTYDDVRCRKCKGTGEVEPPVKLHLTWSLEPERINDLKAVIIVQQGRVPQDHFMAFTDAVQGLIRLSQVIHADNLSNRLTHQLVFNTRLDQDLVDQIEASIELVYGSKCEAVEIEPLEIKWSYTDPIKARLGTFVRQLAKPLSKRELVQKTATASMEMVILDQIKTSAKVAKAKVDAGDWTHEEAWKGLYFLITHEVIQ